MNFGPKRLEIIIRNVLRHDFLDRAVVFLRIWGRCDISLRDLPCRVIAVWRKSVVGRRPG